MPADDTCSLPQTAVETWLTRLLQPAGDTLEYNDYEGYLDLKRWQILLLDVSSLILSAQTRRITRLRGSIPINGASTAGKTKSMFLCPPVVYIDPRVPVE